MSTGRFVGFLVLCTVAQCQFFDALYTYVLDKATDTSIPVSSSRDPVNVSIGMSLVQLTSLDSKSGDAEIEVWMNFGWTDTRLSWDPTNFNDTRVIRLPASKIWLPDVVLYNGYERYPEILTLVDSSGGVAHIPPITLKTRCHVSNYTTDGSVTCRLMYGSWTYDGFLLNVVNTSNEVDVSSYNSDGTQWELTGQKVDRNIVYYSCCPEPFPDVTFTLTFQEKGRQTSMWNIFD